eukprot:scaffold815_cov273-Chaetoceros_neogracile.AAC.23
MKSSIFWSIALASSCYGFAPTSTHNIHQSSTALNGLFDNFKTGGSGNSKESSDDCAKDRLNSARRDVAVIKVGGASEVEVNEKKDRVMDALNATRTAVEEGIVPGGGKALLYCSTMLTEVLDKAANMDQRIGVEIIQRALRAPISCIAMNAGEEGAVVVGELIKEGVPIAMGFDAQNGIYTDMFEAGIIDPTKVTRTGIVDAASVAGLLTTSEAMIVGWRRSSHGRWNGWNGNVK